MPPLKIAMICQRALYDAYAGACIYLPVILATTPLFQRADYRSRSAMRQRARGAAMPPAADTEVKSAYLLDVKRIYRPG